MFVLCVSKLSCLVISDISVYNESVGLIVIILFALFCSAARRVPVLCALLHKHLCTHMCVCRVIYMNITALLP